MERFELFLEDISEVKQIIFNKVMATQYQQCIVEQKVLRQLTTEKILPVEIA